MMSGRAPLCCDGWGVLCVSETKVWRQKMRPAQYIVRLPSECLARKIVVVRCEGMHLQGRGEP